MKDTNNFQLTRNFNLKEFEDPTTHEVKISSRLVGMLQSLRNEVGPLIISSGYRTREHNKKVKGHKNSAHLYGLAVDIFTFHFTLMEVEKKAKTMEFHRVIKYRKHIHLAIK